MSREEVVHVLSLYCFERRIVRHTPENKKEINAFLRDAGWHVTYWDDSKLLMAVVEASHGDGQVNEFITPERFGYGHRLEPLP